MANNTEILENKQAKDAAEAPTKRYTTPAVDIRESKTAYLVTADVPGADESGIEIVLEKDKLEFTARTSFPQAEGRRGVYREFGDYDYRRSFHLNVEVDRDNIKATVKNGVLSITLPKKEATVRKIAVNAA